LSCNSFFFAKQSGENCTSLTSLSSPSDRHRIAVVHRFGKIATGKYFHFTPAAALREFKCIGKQLPAPLD